MSRAAAPIPNQQQLIEQLALRVEELNPHLALPQLVDHVYQYVHGAYNPANETHKRNYALVAKAVCHA